MKPHFNQRTDAFVHDYEPIRIFLDPHACLPARAHNFVARALRTEAASGFGGAYLFELVSSPAKAQFVLPAFDANWFARDTMRLCEYADARRAGPPLLLIDSRDESSVLPIPNAVWLKTSVSSRTAAESVICIPYVDTVDDFRYFDIVNRDPAFGASFVGARTAYRSDFLAHMGAVVRFPMHVSLRSDCFLDRHLRADAPAYDLAQRRRRERERREFVGAALNSRYLLALPGHAANTSRFFEALALGVSPVLVGDTVLPFSDRIPYERFIFHVHGDPGDAARETIGLIESNWEAAASRGRLASLFYHAHLSSSGVLFELYRSLSRLIASTAHEGQQPGGVRFSDTAGPGSPGG